MSDPTVSERRIRPIQDAIASANWKQAIQLCDKWSKKGEKSDRFLALKAFVLVNQPDASQHDRGRSETIQLCRREPPVTDVDALHQIQDTLKNLSLQSEEGPKLWDRAVASKPNDKDLLMTWLNRSVSESNWLSAQKATMALRKAFPKDRDYEFWNILMCYLVHKDASLPEKTCLLFGTLAYRLISKAAKSVPIEKDQHLSAGKAIQKPEELHLLARIYLSLGYAAEAIGILQSDNLGFQSRFAELDPQLVLSLLLECFEKALLWEGAVEFCKELLSNDKYKSFSPSGDDRIWKLLVRAANSSVNETIREQVNGLIQETLAADSTLRSVHQAKLQLLESNAGEDKSQFALAQACREYLNIFSGKAYCFEDLKNPISKLNPDLKAQLFRDLMREKTEEPTSPNLRQSLFNLKLQYYFNISSPMGPCASEDFPTTALELYNSSLGESNPTPEACLLAALTLIQSSQKIENGKLDNEYLFQAAILLEVCCKRTEDYFPAVLFLIRTQLVFGFISAAMTNFKRLNVKNLQWETVGHLIMTRMSTLHPQQHGKTSPSQESGFNPLEALDSSLTVSENAARSLSQQIYRGLQSGSYANVVESVQIRSDMQHSTSLQMCAIEERRIRRLRGMSDDAVLKSRPAVLVDHRDFSDFVDFDISNTVKHDYLRCGPLANEKWLDAMTIYDSIFSILKADLQSHPGSAGPTLDDINCAYSRAKDIETSTCSELTDTEVLNLECHLLIAYATIEVKAGTSANQSQLDESLDKIERWLQSRFDGKTAASSRKSGEYITSQIGGIQFPSWLYLHFCFSCLETLQLLSAFISAMSKKPKSAKSKNLTISKERLSQLRELLVKTEAGIHDNVKKVKEGLNASGVLGKLVDVALGKKEGEEDSSSLSQAIEKLCDAATLETFCGAMRESWEDALDGILAVKVKTFK